jgi:hypothetical protein
MFIVCLHIKFHVPSSNVSLVTSLIPKANENSPMNTMLLFYILQKYYFNKPVNFSNIYNQI